MRRGRFVAAWAAAAAVILSAPFTQQLFVAVSARWPDRARTLGIAATALPAAAMLVAALWCIRDRRMLRYALAALGISLAAAYIPLARLTFTEGFHFAEYGLLAWLFYRAWRPSTEDWSIIALPLMMGTIVGSLDEWFQWFIPIRAGEARDVVINNVATACGLLVAIAIEPPARLVLALDAGRRAVVARWAVAAVVVFALFFHTVHVGYDVDDPEIGSFRSRFTAAELARASRDRAARWRESPPVVQRRLWREDHYLSEALWHVQQRNRAWDGGDMSAAWRENRILEKFYAPVLEVPTYADPAGHGWPPAQRETAAQAAGASPPYASDAYAYPLYTLTPLF